MAVAPALFRSGQTENISVSLFDGSQPARGTVRLALLHDGSRIVETRT
jgi:hypothetical protein